MAGPIIQSNTLCNTQQSCVTHKKGITFNFMIATQTYLHDQEIVPSKHTFLPIACKLPRGGKGYSMLPLGIKMVIKPT